MRRRALLAHLRTHGCRLLREGKGHSVYLNPASLRTSTVPRHREISPWLARKICRDLGVPAPAEEDRR